VLGRQTVIRPEFCYYFESFPGHLNGGETDELPEQREHLLAVALGIGDPFEGAGKHPSYCVPSMFDSLEMKVLYPT
jgi:hypothetical protein